MTQNDSQRGEPRASAESPVFEGKASKTDRDAESRAVLDNMARLKALRLAREAIEPPPAAKKVARAKPGQKSKSASKKDDKPKALSDWLASQQNGGRRV